MARRRSVRPSGPRAPVVAGRCSATQRTTLMRAYADAYAMATAAARAVAALPSDAAARKAAWNRGPLRRIFGAYRGGNARRVAAVLTRLLGRFARGWPSGAGYRPVVLDCFPATYARCKRGLLGNASVPGRLRLCPELLARSRAEVAGVVLHELLHRGLGVGDQRHSSCRSDRKHRCYRDAGLGLAAQGRSDLAIRNIDNYVFLARAATMGAARRSA